MIIPGDNIEALRSMPENSVDAIVTDPPYGLSFMGKKWDYDVPSVAFWTEALRVLKPGGHVLCFGGTRTYHRVAVAIEDAGFELRDSIHWLYGSGFPKSLDVSKALDKMAGAVREVVRHRARAASSGALSGSAESRPWIERSRASGFHEAAGPIAVTDAAKAWSGWGTALKPGHEPIIVARKPLDGTVAENVLRCGTGALNIDACRVRLAVGAVTRAPQSDPSKRKGVVEAVWSNEDTAKFQEVVRAMAERIAQTGRWPPNVVFSHSVGCVEGGACVDGCPVADLDGQHAEARGFFPCVYPDADLDDLTPFLYCAKPARSEREAGCEHLPARSGAEAVDREEGTDGLKSPRAGAGRTAESVRNHHPTVKPVALMRWLVRLATPPGGVVLDPFCGSGTTLVATTLEGALGLGLEREPEYVAIAEARVAHAAKSR